MTTERMWTARGGVFRVLSRTLIGALAVGALSSPATGQDEIPRTAWGKPDLSGFFDIASLTPFERDPRYGERLELTLEEAKAIEQQAATMMKFLNRPSNPERQAPPAGGDGSPGAAGAVGGYNAFWIDNGTETLPVDGKFRTSILIDPPDGRMPVRTELGERLQAARRPYTFKNSGDAWWFDEEQGPYDDPESLAIIERCLYVGPATVPMIPVLYNNLKRIVQTETEVLILVEWMHWARTIRIDAEPPPPHIRSLGGESVGRWEGDTLVVETTNFLEKPGVPSDRRIVERFSRVDANTLNYQFTVFDPEYSAPYTGELPFPQTTDKLYEYACHEGNYAMGNILRGARLLEKEEAERRAAGPSKD